MAEVKGILASEAKSTEILDGIVKKLYNLPRAEKLELSRLEAVVVLGKLANLTETETFSRIKRIVHRLSPEQLVALKGIARADLFKNDDIDRKLSIVLKPTNIFVSAGNAVIFTEGGFKSWLDMWEPGQNIVAIKTLKGAKQLDAKAFVQQNFFSGGVFARYQVPGLHVGEPVTVDGNKIDTVVVPEDLNSGRPEMRILYFGPEINHKKAIEILRKLGIGPDVVAEYGPGKDEGGGKGGTRSAGRIRDFVAMGLPVICASPVNKDGIKAALKSLGLNPKIAFKEALYAHNRDKVTSNVWAVDTLSCTSNAILSAIVAMHEAFGVKSGSGETIHAMTASNAVFPQPSGRARDPVDVLRGISVIQDIQEASTGAKKNLFKIIPELEGNFPITAKRVGVITGSAFTIHMRLKREVTKEEVREALRNFANNKSNGMVRFYEGIPGVVDAPLDTNAIVGWSEVSIIDGFLIEVLDTKDEVIIKGLYDNESAAPGQIASRWAPWIVDARRAKELLVPSPVNVETAKLTNPPYMSAMGRKDYEGKKVLERLDLNIPDVKGTPKKVTAAVKTVVTPLENGAKTVIVLSHRGRPDGKVDMDSSLGPVAEKFKEVLKEQGYNYEVIFHPGSITNKGLAKGLKQKIVPGAINILEDTRFYEGEEGNDWVFAAGLADLVDNEIFIFDAFGAAERTGGSLDLVASYVEKIGLGLIMENEDENLQLALQNLHGVIIGGGPKVSEKVPMLQKVIPNMKEGGFLMIGTGPIAPFLKALHNIDVGAEVSENDFKQAQSIIDLVKKYNKKLALPSDFVVVNKDLTKTAEGSEKSWLELKKLPEGAKIYHVTLEQLKQGTFVDTETGDTLSSKNLFIYDIYKQSIEEFSSIILQTPAGRWNMWNGAVGVSEMPQFEVGSREVGKAYLLATLNTLNKADTAVVGSDTGAMADQFKISKAEISALAEKYGIKVDISALEETFSMSDKVSFVSTGGSSALAFMQGKELLVMNGLKKAQAIINIANELKVSAKKVRDFLRVNKASLETLADKELIAAITAGIKKAKDIEKEAERVKMVADVVAEVKEKGDEKRTETAKVDAAEKKLEPDSPEALELAWGKKLAPIAVALSSDINHSLPNQLIDVHYNKQGKVYAILLNHESLLKQGPDGLMALQNYVWQLGEGNIKFVLHINRDDVKPEEADAILDKDLAEINKINEDYTESSRNMFSAVATGTNPGDIARQVKEKLGADIYQVFGPESYVEQFSIAKIKVILDPAAPGQFTSMAKAFKLIELIPEEGKVSTENLQALDKLFSQDREGNFHVKAVEVGKEVLDQVEKYKEEVAAKISI
jgi:phosphoglycerate kinase